MPNTLMDMFQPRSLADPDQPIGFGDAIAQNRQSLIGLGMGLLQPISLAHGAPAQSPMGNALGGYQQGAAQDARQANVQAQLAHQKRQEAFQRSQAARAQFNADRAFKAGQITDAQRAMADVLGSNATPEQKADFMRNYYASKTDPGTYVLKDVIDPTDPDGERKITVQEHTRTGHWKPLTMPGQPGTAGTAIDPFASGATPRPVYGAGGDFSTPPAAAPAAPAQLPARGITLPSGEVVTPPPGLSKKARDAWAQDVAKTVADMQTGKMTEAQAKYSIYASGMEIAQRELQGLEGAGTSPGTSSEGKGLGGLPWGVGAFFQSNEYQNYRNAKDAWLNAKLRAESGATINPDEFARDDRIYFPQPGEGPEQVAAKKKLREHITQKMTKAGGPGYQSPPTVPAVTPAAPAAAGGGATFNERFTGNAAAPAAPASARRGIPPPPAGFNIVQ